VTATNTLDRLNKLHQMTGGSLKVEDGGAHRLRDISTAKRDALQQILESTATDEPVVVFCIYTGDILSIHAAAKTAGRNCFELSGKKNELSEWQKSSQGDVLAVQMQAGGLGISLVRSRYCVYYSVGFSLGLYMQSLARLLRPGQEQPVTYLHLVVANSVDGKVYNALEKRKNVIEEVLKNVADIEATA